MSYVDVERSAEALQEDQELIEAVENLVETAATSLKSEVLMTIEDIGVTTFRWLEWLFPLWVHYRQEPSHFWDDLGKMALFTVLLAISFALLAPTSAHSDRRRKKQKPWKCLQSTRASFHFLRGDYPLRRRSSIAEIDSVRIQTKMHESHASLFSARKDLQGGGMMPSTICSGRLVTDEEEETDEERFEKKYPETQLSPYRRLVLPPECKLVEKPKRPSIKVKGNVTKSKESKKTKSEKKKKRNNDDDEPAKRLQIYWRNFRHLVLSFIYFDYIGMGWTLIHWLQSVLRIRNYRRSGSQSDLAQEDDDDDDDESKASASQASVRQSVTNNSIHAPLTPERYECNSQTTFLDQSFTSAHMEEKKESPYHLSNREVHTPPSKMTITAFPNTMSNKDDNTAYQNRSRRDSETSLFSTPIQLSREDAKEPDDGSLPYLKMPLTSSLSSKQQGSTTTMLRPAVGVKKKDLLENYRSSSTHNASLLGAQPIHRLNTSSSHNTSATVSSSNSVNNSNNVNNSSVSIAHSHSSASDDTTVTKNHVPDDNSTIGDPCDQNDDQPLPEPNQLQRLESDHDSTFFFETANTQESIFQMSREAPMPDKNGYIVGDEFLPDSNYTPLLVFVNLRSGPQQGHLLITQLRRLLNPIQVWDLGADGEPTSVLESFCAFRNLRILVCGGDGTVSWIIATLEKMNLKRKWPPIAILPLGTGNDLARIHGWGGGYNNESLIGILEQVADSYISLLDRWEMTIENRKGKVKEVKSFFNYLGVGADAQAALQVHMLRESKPQLFFSRVVNKAWYGVFGAEDIIKATSLNLPKEITLIADGVEVPLPPDSQGIILLNIDSYAGGVPMWATGNKSVNGLHGYGYSSSDVGSLSHGGSRLHPPRRLRRTRSLEDLGVRLQSHDGLNMERIDSKEDLSQLLTEDQRYEQVTACDMPSSCQDGILDVISIRGAFHLGQIRVGLSNAQKICQCREATIHIKRKVAVQIDGEPWRQNVCTLKVRRKPDSAIMLHKSDDPNAVETEMSKLLDWAEERKLIDSNVHYTLMKEFSRRIESKTRQRRHKNQDNLMFSLKRAIGSSGAISSFGGNYEYP